MTQTNPTLTVGALVAERPGRARVFERFGIDYCCGGKLPLREACDKRGVDAAAVLSALDRRSPASATGRGSRQRNCATTSRPPTTPCSSASCRAWRR